ncbi:MAG TPA: hydroxymethylbilane synthase [Gemmatimonadaceae bacterium]|nr:hydroxymethylbilane synthase [Gemmatimonadaceae bacterium]
MRTVTIGTRGSALALAQTQIVCDALRALHPDIETVVERITTTGDVRTDVPLSQLDRGMFVTEIESALRTRRIDVAVHSAKDLPSTVSPDLYLAAFLPRADARDVLIARDGTTTLRRLPPGARVGTSSPRRMCQVRALRPDLDVRDVRGNVDTRIRKLRAGEYDALLLAAAGVIRLDRTQEITEWLDADTFIPCVGQGALALEVRASDSELRELVAPLDHAPTRAAVVAERAFLAELGAGCRAAAAAHAHVEGGRAIRVVAMIGREDGRQVRACRVATSDPGDAGRAIAHELLRDGGAAYLARADSTLRGATVVVTRPEGQSGELMHLLEANGARALACPAIAIAGVSDTNALDAALRDVSGAAWIVFTSANAVFAVADRLHALGLSIPRATSIAVVGKATADAVSARLRAPDFTPSDANAASLAAELPIAAGARVLFPRSSMAADTVLSGLRARGAVVQDIVAYDTIPGEGLGALAEHCARGEVDSVVLASPSAARFAARALDDAAVPAGDRPVAVTIGATSTRAARETGWPHVVQAVTPTVGALVEALERAIDERRRATAGSPVSHH